MASIPAGSLAFPLVLTALVPDSAGACPGYYGPCDGAEGWVDLGPRNAAKIPTDGVLVLQGTRAGAGDPFAGVAIEVTRDGQPIAGALEVTPHPHALVWRPSEAWEAGATYQFTGTITNPAGFDSCFAEMIPLAATDLIIDTVPGAALVAPEFTGTTMVTQSAVISLSTLACCEGAPPPSEGYGGCGGTYVNFDSEQCAATQTNGSFSLDIVGTPAADGPAAQQIVYTRKVDGTPNGTQLDPGTTFGYLGQPTCVAFDALDLASGAVTSSPEQCFGEDFADQLGPQPLDPAATLDCPLEQCTIVGMAWDPTMCQPFSPTPDSDSAPTSSDTAPTSGDTGDTGDTDPDVDDGDKACACDETSAPPYALLALGALLLPRRRRAR